MIQLDYLERRIVGRPGTPIKVAVTDTSVQSTALTADVLYMFLADVACHIAFGSNPTATTATCPLAASVPYFFTALEADLVAVIRASGDGSLWITPMDSEA
jgi:hypothetical protein